MYPRLAKSDLLFVAKTGDTLAEKGLAALKREGCNTQLLNPDEHAPIGSIAFYTVDRWLWSSKNIRVAAHRLYPNRPEWAITTPFLAEVRCDAKGNIGAAFIELARQYIRWFTGLAGNSLPWESAKYHTTYTQLLEDWFDQVATAVGDEKARELILNQVKHDKIIGRGGDVVFNRLGNTERVVVSAADLPSDLPANSIYRQLTGFDRPVVSYGTTDLANVFELMQALKTGHALDLPVVFETYPGAHNWGYWVDGFLNPSLALIGGSLVNGAFGAHRDSNYGDITVSPQQIPDVPHQIGLVGIAQLVASWLTEPTPIWRVYHKAMETIADRFLESAGVSVQYRLTTFEQICQLTRYWHMNARKLADEVVEKAGHDVVLLNTNDGKQLNTRGFIPFATVAELHRQGWWLGGSAIYNLTFSLGLHGGIVSMVKDSGKGLINMMAKHYFGDNSGLYLAPVGLFRLSAEGQNEDWSIDPLVLLEIMERWGEARTRLELRKIWEAMEVPLNPRHIGRKTLATVTLDGVNVRVVDI